MSECHLEAFPQPQESVRGQLSSLLALSMLGRCGGEWNPSCACPLQAHTGCPLFLEAFPEPQIFLKDMSFCVALWHSSSDDGDGPKVELCEPGQLPTLSEPPMAIVKTPPHTHTHTHKIAEH